MDFRKGKQEEPLEINLVPLIDVMMVILIFLMITTTYSKYTELQINLPTADAEKQLERTNEITVLVSAQGQYVINRNPIPFRGVEQLAEELTRAAGTLKAPLVVISADAAATHQAVARVMEPPAGPACPAGAGGGGGRRSSSPAAAAVRSGSARTAWRSPRPCALRMMTSTCWYSTMGCSTTGCGAIWKLRWSTAAASATAFCCLPVPCASPPGACDPSTRWSRMAPPSRAIPCSSKASCCTA